MTNDYYNEIDQFAADWLLNLATAGEIPAGKIHIRSIKDVTAADVAGYRQCHFFAGIGGWPLALKLARWPESEAVWTGSCPCQPFSDAGKKKGTADARHLWPDFHRLIAECRPPTIFGEQVASKGGREWLARVRADLEALGYAVGCADLCAAGQGSPHIRQRLFWVADDAQQRQRQGSAVVGGSDSGIRAEGNWGGSADSGDNGGLAVASGAELGRWRESEREHGRALHPPDGRCVSGLGNTGSQPPRRYDRPTGNSAATGAIEDERRGQEATEFAGASATCGLGEPSPSGLPLSEHQDVPGAGRGIEGGTAKQPGRASNRLGLAASILGGSGSDEPQRGPEGRVVDWGDCSILECTDGKSRRIERGSFPLANGIPRDLGRQFPELRKLAQGARRNRVGRLRGYWTSNDFTNAIRQAFHESPREQIVRIDIERDGITAYFEKKNC